MPRKSGVVSIASRNKQVHKVLNDEAKAVLRRKALTDNQLLKIFLSNEEADLPDSAQCRMLALDALYLRGYKIFDEAL
jgi:hypothetical protein